MTNAFQPGITPIIRAMDFIEGSFDDCLQASLDVLRQINSNVNRHRKDADQVPPPKVTRFATLTPIEKTDICLPMVHPGVSTRLLTETQSG